MYLATLGSVSSALFRTKLLFSRDKFEWIKKTYENIFSKKLKFSAFRTTHDVFTKRDTGESSRISSISRDIVRYKSSEIFKLTIVLLE